MRINELVEGIGEFIQWTFGILTGLGNLANWAIIAVGTVMMVLWIKKMSDFNKKADQDGTLR